MTIYYPLKNGKLGQNEAKERATFVINVIITVIIETRNITRDTFTLSLTFETRDKKDDKDTKYLPYFDNHPQR